MISMYRYIQWLSKFSSTDYGKPCSNVFENFSKMGDKPYTKAVKQDIFSHVSKVTIF